MDLVIIRHAEAAAVDADIKSDEDRPLTAKGRHQAEMLGHALPRVGARLAILVTSPVRRARETAEELRSAMGSPDFHPQLCEALAPGGKRRDLARYLRAHAQEGTVGIVGHQPDLSAFTCWLIGSRKACIRLAKAGVAYVTCDPEPRKGTGTLIWLGTPALLETASRAGASAAG